MLEIAAPVLNCCLPIANVSRKVLECLSKRCNSWVSAGTSMPPNSRQDIFCYNLYMCQALFNMKNESCQIMAYMAANHQSSQ
eukprot:scaffold39373_cov43-Prasinocladus_malaysianus.AAC.2